MDEKKLTPEEEKKILEDLDLPYRDDSKKKTNYVNLLKIRQKSSKLALGVLICGLVAFGIYIIYRSMASSEITIKGTIYREHGDDFKNNKSADFYLIISGSQHYYVYSSKINKDIASGSQVTVKGIVKGKELAVNNSSDVTVTHLATINQPQTSSQTPVQTRSKNVAIFIITVKKDCTTDCPILPTTITQDHVNQAFFTDPKSVSNYYKADSYNQFNLSGNIIGSYTVTDNSNSCDFSAWSQSASQAAINAGKDLSNYQYKLFFVNQGTHYCPWGGMAGSVQSPYGDAFVFDTYENADPVLFSRMLSGHIYTAAHEIGHLLGWSHAKQHQCVDTSGKLVPISNNCTDDEYGDRFDVMGGGIAGSLDQKTRMPLSNCIHKYQMGWIPFNKIQDIKASGTYTLSTIDLDPRDASYPVIARIHRGGAYPYYFLEYRSPLNKFDSPDPITPEYGKTGGLFIRLEADFAPNPAYQTKYSGLIHVRPIDQDIYLSAALIPGLAFYDPDAKIKIKTISYTKKEITFKVNFEK